MMSDDPNKGADDPNPGGAQDPARSDPPPPPPPPEPPEPSKEAVQGKVHIIGPGEVLIDGRSG